MSQEINLYEDRLRPRHEFETGRNVAISLGILLALVLGLALWGRIEADRASAELAKMQSEVRSAQEKMTALTKNVSERKISPALKGELEATRAMLEARNEVVAYLDSGSLGSNSGFSGLMFGFSRVAQNNLWLTGFSASRGGQDIEIRGSLLDSTQLPAYVQRLSADPVFHGRRFAALDMKRVAPAEAKNETGRPVDGAVPGTVGVPRIEFVLRSENIGERAASTGKAP